MGSRPGSPADGGADQEGDVAVQEAPPGLDEPGRFAVILLNDNYTTMEFVMDVLRRYFKKNTVEAHALMLQVHEKGRGVAGIYTFEIAETKVAQVTREARGKGFPLQLILEEVRS
jgi:ATP-dependent Clp protease adaptor protein ClpS